MRDIVVTEYGIADLRGRSDAETVAGLLEKSDSRFQDGLEERAQKTGKLPKAYQLPETARNNTPAALLEWLAPYSGRDLPRFPFGTDFTAIEQYLIPALAELRHAKWPRLLSLILLGLRGSRAGREREALERLALAAPAGVRERFSALAVRGALRQNR